MKHFFLPIIIFLVLTHMHSDTLVGMELTRAESERLQIMHDTLNENGRIGQLATLIIEKHVNESYFYTISKEANTHNYIAKEEKTTAKSYTCKYTYNPFILKGSCPANEKENALSAAFLIVMAQNFNPETTRNSLNDLFFKKYDSPDNFQQVDFCVSAKYVESNKYYEYIARFFNKEALLKTIELFDPEALKNS